MNGKCVVPRQTFLVAEHPYLTAATVDVGQAVYLSVYRSPIVQELDSMYTPILDVLADVCFDIEFEATIQDRGFVFAEATWTLMVIYRECPGGQVAHNCLCERREEAVSWSR